ncbi:dilute domain-containing protein [Anaeramoeba ignava]|uniref:Dilute domain-containing protein n=1 Tax=Anaeramoeba ignava TaxID=1746090 RepID=A0A9Q0LAH9_ANAIG|nr:dilute domain-containing protein [Anaeramoeba ignava]
MQDIKIQRKNRLQLQFGIVCIAHLSSELDFVFVTWKRGARKGQTNFAHVSNTGFVSFNQEFQIQATLFYDRKKQKISPKILQFTLKKGRSINKNESQTIGKLWIDVGNIFPNEEPLIKDYSLFIKNDELHGEKPIILLCMRLVKMTKFKLLPNLLDLPVIQDKVQAFTLIHDKSQDILDEHYSQISIPSNPLTEPLNEESLMELSENSDIDTIMSFKETDFIFNRFVEEMKTNGNSPRQNHLNNNFDNRQMFSQFKDHISVLNDDDFVQVQKKPQIEHQNIFEQKQENLNFETRNPSPFEQEKPKYPEAKYYTQPNEISSLKIVDIIEEEEEEKKKEEDYDIPEIQEKLHILSEQQQILNGLQSQLQIYKVIRLEKWLIENSLYFNEGDFGRKYPIPSTVIIKFLVYFEGFTKNPLLSRIIINSFKYLTYAYIKDKENTLKFLSVITTLRAILDQEIWNQNPQSIALEKFRSDLNLIAQENLKNYIENLIPSTKFILKHVFFPVTLPKDYQKPKARVTLIKERFSTVQLQDHLNETINLAKFYLMPEKFIQIILFQLCSFINIFLFNQLCSKKNLCKTSFAIHIKIIISQLEDWIKNIKFGKFSHSSFFKEIKQGATCLVMNKKILSSDGSFVDVCPDLNINQIFQLLSNFTPDSMDDEQILHSQLASLRLRTRNLLQKTDQVLIQYKDFSFEKFSFLNIPIEKWDRIHLPEEICKRKGLTFLIETIDTLRIYSNSQNQHI